MAIKMVDKKGFDGNAVLNCLNIDYSYIEYMKSIDITAVLSYNKLSLVSKHGVVLEVLSITMGDIAAMKDGSMTLLQKKALRAALHLKIQNLPGHIYPKHSKSLGAMALLEQEPTLGSILADASSTPGGDKIQYAAKQVDVVKDVINDMKSVSQTEYSEIYPQEQMSTGITMKLRDAQKMYQPVKGTDSSSRYFLIAAATGLRIAARYKTNAAGGSLSIRVEGPLYTKYMPQLVAAGFEKNDQEQGYSSMHVGVPDDKTAAKCLGAILLGTEIALKSPYPDLKRIKNIGS